MRELSLFSGAGGGLLASKHLFGWRTIGYVEIDDYCQKVIKARIKDGLLDDAPIFGDIRAFIDQGYAEAYQGMVDVITAGFPCQPFSVAGKRKGEDDERNMWPATLRSIEIIQPRGVLLENVPGIRRYLPRIVGDLCRAGFAVGRPLKLGADDLYFPHHRKRIWIFANAKCNGLPRVPMRETPCEERHDEVEAQPLFIPSWPARPRTLADIPRMDDGLAHRVDRLKAIGNGQVPAVAAAAWRILNG